MDDIIQKIVSSTGMSIAEVENKIEEKRMEFGGLVSKEGSAYILAKELGMDLIRKKKEKITIDKIIAGQRGLNFNARLVRKFPTREFTSSGRNGKVANIILGDETGTIRMSLWNNQIDIINSMEEGNGVEVFGAYVKEDNRNEPEVRIGFNGGIRFMEKCNIPEIEISKEKAGKKLVCEVGSGDIAEIRANIVQLFETEIFYEICPECGKRVREEEDFKCKEHGKVEPKYTFVVSGVIDDGSGNLRVVLFRELGAKLLGMEMEDVLGKRGRLYEGIDVLGKEFVFEGRARNNQMFNRLEFIVSDLREVDMKEEINSTINSFGGNS